MQLHFELPSGYTLSRRMTFGEVRGVPRGQKERYNLERIEPVSATATAAAVGSADPTRSGTRRSGTFLVSIICTPPMDRHAIERDIKEKFEIPAGINARLLQRGFGRRAAGFRDSIVLLRRGHTTIAVRFRREAGVRAVFRPVSRHRFGARRSELQLQFDRTGLMMGGPAVSG